MTHLHQPILNEICWKDIRSQVFAVNPTLGKIIDNIDPAPTKYPLYEAVYPYGYNSVRRGELFLPNGNNQAVPLDDASLSNKVKHDLGYNIGSNPVTLLLTNSMEIYMTRANHTIPFIFASAGDIISIRAKLDMLYKCNHQPPFLWNISAGARSIISLSKISVESKFKKLASHFNIPNMERPDTLLAHGRLFRLLAQSHDFDSAWRVKVLYFSGKWFEHLDNKSKAWQDFYNYLLQYSWITSSYHRSEFAWKPVFSLIQQLRNLKSDPFLIDIVEHLLAIAAGAYPGFIPAKDDTAAPITKFQEILSNVYQLDRYTPIIMQPSYFTMGQDTQPIYYSLSYPTTSSFAPKAKKLATKRENLSNIKYALDKYLVEIASGKLNLHATSIGSIPNKVKYDYFHTNPLERENIRDSQKIFDEDSAFSGYEKSQIPEKSIFFRGCIRISNIF
jgi:hypothetical protein